MVILSCLAKKNQNLNARKKSSVYYWKLHFQGRNAHKPPFSVIKWTFFPRSQILIFLPKSIQNNHIRLLYKFENDQTNFGCVGSCGYAPASVKYGILFTELFRSYVRKKLWILNRIYFTASGNIHRKYRTNDRFPVFPEVLPELVNIQSFMPNEIKNTK